MFKSSGGKIRPRSGLDGSSGFHLLGGGQESGRRAGTENVLLIAGLGKACDLAATELHATAAHMRRLRGR